MANYVNRASGKLFHAKSRDKTHVLICQLAHACTHMHVQIHMYTHKPRMHMYTQNIKTCNYKPRVHTDVHKHVHTHMYTHMCTHTHDPFKHTCNESLADKWTKQCDILTMFPPHHRFYLILILVFFLPNIYFQGQRQGDALDRGGKKKHSRGNKVADPPGSWRPRVTRDVPQKLRHYKSFNTQRLFISSQPLFNVLRAGKGRLVAECHHKRH